MKRYICANTNSRTSEELIRSNPEDIFVNTVKVTYVKTTDSGKDVTFADIYKALSDAGISVIYTEFDGSTDLKYLLKQYNWSIDEVMQSINEGNW